MKTEKVINLTASNLGYDLGCPRCLWFSAVAGIKQPGGFFSAAIREMEKTQREIFKDRNLTSLNPAFPNGKVEKSLGRPKTIEHKVSGAQVVISGQYDHLVKLVDGDYALLAFKTSDPTKNLEAITTQYNALAYTMNRHKNPDDVRKIVKIGIAVFDTNAFDRGEPSTEFYKYFPLELDGKKFEKQLAQVVNSLKCDVPDYSDDKDCEFCKYQRKIEELTKPKPKPESA